MPSLGAMVRARWSVLLAGSPRSARRVSPSSRSPTELCSIVGPAAATPLAYRGLPRLRRSSGGPAAPDRDARGSPRSAAPSRQRSRRTGPPARPGIGPAGSEARPHPGLVVLARCVPAVSATMFVSIDLSTVAFAQHFGHKPLAGVILGTYAFGSATGGIWYGSRQWRAPIENRFAFTLALTVLGVATFWAQPNLITLTCGYPPARAGHRADPDRRVQPARGAGRARSAGPRPCPG